MNQQTDQLPVHPAANVFPMLPDDELQELAEDIKQNGLRESLKVQHGLLIEGRNRREACRIAGVEPTSEELDSSIDPVAYIISANINRRHLSKGQRAMIVAMIYPEPGKGGRGKKNPLLNKEFSDGYVSKARTVLAVLPERATQVRDGVASLNDAYEEVQGEKQATERTERFAQMLREEAPDLAAHVDEERMTLQDAHAAFQQRKSVERTRRTLTFATLEKWEAFAPRLEGTELTKMVETIRSRRDECFLTDVRKLADRLATGWHNLHEALRTADEHNRGRDENDHA